MWSVRPFFNSDTPALAKVWASHTTAYNSRSVCPVSAWDNAILSKPYFKSEELLVAEDSKGEIVGWLHFSGPPEGMGSSKGNSEISIDSKSLILHQLCVRTGEDESAIAQQLLRKLVELSEKSGAVRVLGLGAFDQSFFYLGFGDGDGMLGVTSQDTRLLGWLKQSGLCPLLPTECWELPLAHFRPPMDRAMLAVLRSSTISRVLEEFKSDWLHCQIYGHCDEAVFQLKSKPTSPNHPATAIEIQLAVWAPTPANGSGDSAVARINLPIQANDSHLQDHFCCLLAESVRQMQLERKTAVRVVIDPQRSNQVQLLQRLGFKTKHHGILLERRLRDAVDPGGRADQ